MRVPKNLFTLKIISSYLLLAFLALLVSIFVYGEIRDYFTSESEVKGETKLLMANSLLTQLHEAESLCPKRGEGALARGPHRRAGQCLAI